MVPGRVIARSSQTYLVPTVPVVEFVDHPGQLDLPVIGPLVEKVHLPKVSRYQPRQHHAHFLILIAKAEDGLQCSLAVAGYLNWR